MIAIPRVFGIAPLAAFIAATSGCATITRGTTEVLVVNSDPPGAEVQISSGNVCTTPCSVELKRKRDYHVKIGKDGYEPVETDVLSQIVGAGAAGMAGNVVLGGLIGAGIDAYSGAMKGLKPNPVEVRLVPSNGTSQAPLSTRVLTKVSAATTLAAVRVEDICDQPSKVDQADCRGSLKLGMSREETLQVLGLPDGKSADDKTLRYADRYLEFDSANRLVKISEVRIQ